VVSLPPWFATDFLGWLQSTIGNGVRSSSATAYLGPEFIRRKNLDILLHAQVTKLVHPSHAGGKLFFGGVQFQQGKLLLLFFFDEFTYHYRDREFLIYGHCVQ
jgi:choline dehydrogenase-like flavoprotein